MQPLNSVRLRQLFPAASFIGCADLRVRDAVCSSAEVIAGCLFAAVPGTARHGREFVGDAVLRGAKSLLLDRPLAECPLPQCIVPNVREAYAHLCHALFAHPTRHLGVVGVTGTNGKTTTTWMVRSILEAARGPSGLIGTIETSDGIGRTPATLTTPGSRDLARLLASTRRNQVPFAALELSSHALDQCRTAGTQLDVAVVTNLTQDHFDYHGTFENYRLAKSRIFGHLKRGGTAVLNADDAAVMSLLTLTGSSQVVTYGLHPESQVRGEIIDQSVEGTRFRVTAGTESAICVTPLIGRYNVSNALAAIASCRQLGLNLPEMISGLERLSLVPGRMQRVHCGQPFEVWVDYAHTEDGLRGAIAAVRPLVSGRLTVVFGAGGDRDPSKRACMGRAAAEADVAIVTSDNPRSECPDAIAEQIVSGWPRSTPPQVCLNRESAIRQAIHAAGPGDGVLIAGKGHEEFQIIGTEKRPFRDIEISREAIATHPQQPHHWLSPPQPLKIRNAG
jgi:UDP-N-acetylmuramoyl-L-alanyl-D-glutamate--2,6-diaminopimelate ligase